MELCENTGKVNWGAVLNSQSENKERNNIIIKIVKEFDDRIYYTTILIKKKGKIDMKTFEEAILNIFYTFKIYFICSIIIIIKDEIST